ncbi:mucin-2-like [Stegostoma tigrinum]|uniref:mucin-2-like n=1 Tax=Stegostoma tigrinum TaxID=3053191 RepID=UPI00287074D7|nr:mucin-2-like [Stegostoma tigrinum]
MPHQRAARTCSFKNTSLRPGEKVHQKQGNTCKTYTCTRKASGGGSPKLTTSTKTCVTTCSTGFELRDSRDKNDCCPECVQVKCIYNSPTSPELMLEPNQMRHIDACTRVYCTSVEGHVITQEAKEHCSTSLEACIKSGGEMFASEGSCCQMCAVAATIQTCSAVVKNVKLIDGICSGQVNINVCEDRCSSMAQNNPDTAHMITQCGNCVPKNTKFTKVTLTCGDGTTSIYTIIEPVSCQCKMSDCRDSE